MKSTSESRATAFTTEEFIRAFRPDGLGHIRMEDGEGKEVFDCTFEEIVCDICNCEMVQPEDDPLKKVVFVLDGYALCEDCNNATQGEGEDLSLSSSLNTDLVVEALTDYRRWFDGNNEDDVSKRRNIDRATFLIQHVKGGGWKMADEYNNKETATLCFTKAGRGAKVVVDGVWFYTSKESLLELVNGKSKACTFHTIKDEVAAQ